MPEGAGNSIRGAGAVFAKGYAGPRRGWEAVGSRQSAVGSGQWAVGSGWGKLSILKAQFSIFNEETQKDLCALVPLWFAFMASLPAIPIPRVHPSISPIGPIRPICLEKGSKSSLCLCVVSLHSTSDVQCSMLEAPLPYLSFLCVNNPFSPSFDLERSMLDVGIEKSFSVVSLLGDLCVLAVIEKCRERLASKRVKKSQEKNL